MVIWVVTTFLLLWIILVCILYANFVWMYVNTKRWNSVPFVDLLPAIIFSYSSAWALGFYTVLPHNRIQAHSFKEAVNTFVCIGNLQLKKEGLSESLLVKLVTLIRIYVNSRSISENAFRAIIEMLRLFPLLSYI